MRFLKGNQDTSRAPNNNKQPCSCQTSLRNLLFHLVQRISLHFKSTDLYLFCTTKVFPKFLLPFQSQASFQSEQFGSYDYAARSLSLVACSLTSQRSRMLMQKRPLLLMRAFLQNPSAIVENKNDFPSDFPAEFSVEYEPAVTSFLVVKTLERRGPFNA